ncbi:MAG: hypothetical protein IJX24_05340, partial [Oscillospiraceae bacterium]|nr:hypothetical protein [Oscillospiraceae bacterium]
MALGFFKKGFFKKSNDNPEKNNMQQNIMNDVKPAGELNKLKTEVEIYATQEDKENAIKKRLEISVNSPLKLLWNVYYAKSEGNFSPLEYVLKPIIETNTRLNEISESEEYVSFDENQKDFLVFTKRIQSLSVKYLKEIISDSVEDDLDSFSKDIEIHEFESILKETTDHSTYEEMKYACENKRKAGRTKPFDAQSVIYVSKDRLHAWIMVIPPLNGGSEI